VSLLAVAAAAVLAASAGPVVPGLALHFGERLGEVDSTRSWKVDATSAPGSEVRRAETAFFGVPAVVLLRFAGRRLATAEATAENASPADIDHVNDELRRMGFRRWCGTDEPDHGTCVWTGHAIVSLGIDGTSLHAMLEPAPEPVPAAAPAPMASPPVFTLGDPASAGRLPMPEVLRREEPVYPPSARKAGVMGRVRVRASVDSTGAVTAAETVNSIPSLDRAAMDCVRKWRFRPYSPQGRAIPFQIVIPVLFVLDP
jgi:TonB family protein